MPQTEDISFLKTVVETLTGNECKIERKIDDLGVLLELKVDKVDMGKIIGKEGQTAKAIRILLRVLGARLNSRINLKILE